MLKSIRKRDGQVEPFDSERIIVAVQKAMIVTGEGDRRDAEKIAKGVIKKLEKETINGSIPTVEQVQDFVEKELILESFAATAKAYILYREEHARLRAEHRSIPEEFKKLVEENKKYFRNPLAEFVYYRTYSRWLDEKGRRETWEETVNRFMNYMQKRLGTKIKETEYKELKQAILYQDIVPSMRLLWSSGPAAEKTNVSAYNCSFITPTALQDFGEIMYLLTCGTGVGYSVEKKTVEQLPDITPQTGKKLPTHVVGDSKEGWADSLVLGLKTWYGGKDIEFDYSKVRPQGARLKTMGGKSSGPAPLKALLDFARARIFEKQGRKLSTLDVHDIICKIGELVVAGGVRRSALISLSDLNDELMRDSKAGAFYLKEPQRSMANNSAIYNTMPSTEEFLTEWLALIKSGSGERGIFNRGGLKTQLPQRRWKIFEKHASTSGTNPCGEIILRSKQFCNLTSVVVRPEDTEKTLIKKIQLATILGTYQASLTDFPYLTPEWKKNCEEEALLGVSITGYWDNKIVRSAKVLSNMRRGAIKVNKVYAKRMGINPSTCITCIKPSGNSSQLLDTASGMHPRYSKYYLRRVRVSSTDSLLKMLQEQGVPSHPEVGQDPETASTFVLEFPVKAPDGAIVKDDISALELLKHWKLLKENFTEHNPSATIYVGPEEWIQVSNWVYENWNKVGGLSFLPRNNHVYQLAPYEEIDKKTYEELNARVANIDFSHMYLYENEDETAGAKEYACVSGACEL